MVGLVAPVVVCFLVLAVSDVILVVMVFHLAAGLYFSACNKLHGRLVFLVLFLLY